MDDYQHRSEDENGNADDLYTEKEALAIAKEQGIEFVDTFSVNGDPENQGFPSRGGAVLRAQDLGLDELNIIQTRRQK